MNMALVDDPLKNEKYTTVFSHDISSKSNLLLIGY